jgi:hypothetical protein
MGKNSTQRHIGSGASPAGRDPGPRACNACERNPHQGSPHEVPGARGSERTQQAAGGPTGPPRHQWVWATSQSSFATEQVVLNTAQTTFNQRVTPSRARQAHGDGDLTVWPWTQTIRGNRVPVHRGAVRELAERTQRKGNTTATPKCRSRSGEEHFSRERREGLMCAVGQEPHRRPWAEMLSAAGYGARAASQAEAVRERKWSCRPPISEGQRRSKQVRIGAQHELQPGMLRGDGGSTQVKGSQLHTKVRTVIRCRRVSHADAV